MKTLNLTPELFVTYEELMSQVLDCGAEQVMVAGGAVRDALMGRSIKDIDIFYQGEIDHNKLTKFMEPIHKNPIAYWASNKDGDFLDSVPYPKNDDWDVTYNHMKSKITDKPIQLIKVKKLETHLSTFGAGLCKVALLADGTLWITPEFMKDFSMEILHFDPNCGEKFKDKMCNKFPEFEAMDEVIY